MFRTLAVRLSRTILSCHDSSQARQLLALRRSFMKGSLLSTLHRPAFAATVAGTGAQSLSRQAAAAFATSSAAAAVFNPETRQMGLLGWFLVDLAINWVGWAGASLLKTEKFYDMFGSLSFATLTVGTYLNRGAALGSRPLLVSCMVGAWAARLGTFLVARVFKTGGDSRFDEVKHQPAKFFVYWTMQAIWVFVTLLPVLVVNGAKAHPALRWTDALGASIFAAGLALEATADWQKFKFKMDPANKGKFITDGLWSLSRHPNYFGEMCVWGGVFVTCSASLAGAQFATVVSPLFVFLLLRYVSGVPILERTADQKWGGSAEYQAYKRGTNLLLPLPRLQPKDSE